MKVSARMRRRTEAASREGGLGDLGNIVWQACSANKRWKAKMS